MPAKGSRLRCVAGVAHLPHLAPPTRFATFEGPSRVRRVVGVGPFHVTGGEEGLLSGRVGPPPTLKNLEPRLKNLKNLKFRGCGRAAMLKRAFQ